MTAPTDRTEWPHIWLSLTVFIYKNYFKAYIYVYSWMCLYPYKTHKLLLNLFSVFEMRHVCFDVLIIGLRSRSCTSTGLYYLLLYWNDIKYANICISEIYVKTHDSYRIFGHPVWIFDTTTLLIFLDWRSFYGQWKTWNPVLPFLSSVKEVETSTYISFVS